MTYQLTVAKPVNITSPFGLEAMQGVSVIALRSFDLTATSEEIELIFREVLNQCSSLALEGLKPETIVLGVDVYGKLCAYGYWMKHETQPQTAAQSDSVWVKELFGKPVVPIKIKGYISVIPQNREAVLYQDKVSHEHFEG